MSWKIEINRAFDRSSKDSANELSIMIMTAEKAHCAVFASTVPETFTYNLTIAFGM